MWYFNPSSSKLRIEGSEGEANGNERAFRLRVVWLNHGPTDVGRTLSLITGKLERSALNNLTDDSNPATLSALITSTSGSFHHIPRENRIRLFVFYT